MNKYFVLAATVLLGLFSSCTENVDTTPDPAVGVISVSVVPDGSAIAYEKFVFHGDTIVNSGDSIRYSVTQEALQKTLVKVKPTLFGDAYYNNERITEAGVVMDVTRPVRLEARSGGRVVPYVLNVVQAQIATVPPMEKLSSSFIGFPELLIDWDVAYFKDKFYASVVSYRQGTENGATPENRRLNYDLFTSEDGVNWEQVAYKTNTDGISLKRGQKEYVVGGEGASMVVFKDRLYILGGERSKGRDKLGNLEDFKNGVPQVSAWRSYSTADGETFYCDTIGKSLNMAGQEIPWAAIGQVMNIFGTTPVVYKDKLYLFSAYKVLFGGKYQTGSYIYSTEDGKRWIAPAPVATSTGVAVPAISEAAYFVFKDKMWCVGGFKNFIASGMMSNSIYSTEDGENWTYEGDVPADVMSNVFAMKAVATENVVYLFGGQRASQLDGGVPEFAPNQVLRSTDAINWEVVEVPENFTPIRRAKVVGVRSKVEGEDDKAWLFGGVSSVSMEGYPYPTSAETRSTEIWTQTMK